MAAESAPTPKPKKAKGKGKKRARPKPGRTSERARASVANGALGKKFAALLAEPNSHQLGVCAKLGIPWRTHMDRMAAQTEPGSDAEAYQSAILEALDRQRQLDYEDGKQLLDSAPPAKAASYFNLFKLRHESRFRRFYADDNAQKHQVELTGKDGGPIESENKVRYVVKVPRDEPEEDLEEQ